MEIRVLGPVQVWASGRRLGLDGSISEALLAALVIDADKAVSLDVLVDTAWESNPPATVRRQIRNRLARLRACLVAARFPADVLTTVGSGFMLRTAGVEVDLLRFRGLVSQASAAAHPVRAVGSLRLALECWRGPAFAGLDSSRLLAAADQLTEERLTAWEQCIDLELERGRHRDVVAELIGLHRLHPERETVAAQLMLALYRSGRQAEALNVFAGTRAYLKEQLGLDPGEPLRKMHEQMLRDSPKLWLPPRQAPARQNLGSLPRGAGHFVGRQKEIAWLDSALTDSGSPVRIISGMPGVGKTALAVHWARQSVCHFPDGQFYLNLRGFDEAEPLAPIEAIDQLLHLLGKHPGRPLTDSAQAAATLRGALAGLNALLLLDNVVSAEQVRPLLPGESGSMTIVTSRNRLAGLVAVDGAVRYDLAPLHPTESAELLCQILGPGRVATEAEDADELLARCGHLPLAVAIAGAYLGETPHATARDIVDALRAGSGLDLLSIQDDPKTAVRAVLSLSYQRLSPPQRRLLRLLGAAALTHLNPSGVAQALQLPQADASRQLQSLVQASLLNPPAADRYPAHDLILQYAREVSRRNDFEDERLTALRRLLLHYCELATDADAVLRPKADIARPHPVFADQHAALDFFEHEHENLGALLTEAVAQHWHAEIISLTRATRGYLRRLYRLAEWRRTFELGLAAAEAIGDPEALGHIHEGLADLHYQAREWRQARQAWLVAAAAFGQAGNDYRRALCHDNIGIADLELGDPAAAERHHLEALAIPAYANRPQAAVGTYIHLGIVYGTAKRWDDSRLAFERALRLATDGGYHEFATYALQNLAELARHTGDIERVRAHAGSAIALATRERLPLRAAAGHELLAEVLAAADPAEAGEHRRSALSIYEDLNHPRAITLRQNGVKASR